MEKTLARRLRIERAARGLSLTEAAEKIGIRRDTLSALERGKRGAYSGTLEKIAVAYDLSLGELLSEETTVAPKGQAPAPSPGLDKPTSDERRRNRDMRRRYGPNAMNAEEIADLLLRAEADPNVDRDEAKVTFYNFINALRTKAYEDGVWVERWGRRRRRATDREETKRREAE